MQQSDNNQLSGKILFVLGAGASAPDGVPLQRQILPHILTSTDPALAESELGCLVRSFVETWFPKRPSGVTYPSLEEVFGFIDTCTRYWIDLSAEWTLETIEPVRDALIKCIHFTIHSRRADRPENYRAFWRQVSEAERMVSVVTLNYDSTLEEAYDPLFPESLIDYCLPFMNYEMPSGIDPFNWWINPRSTDARERKVVTHKVLKLHGSLNWKYCRCCRGILLTPWDTQIDLKKGRFIREFIPEMRMSEVERIAFTCPYCQTPFDTLILPPTHLKDLSHPVISTLVNEALYEARDASRVVFVGYSFPPADIHIRALLSRSVRTKSVMVIDPNLADSAKDRYFAVSSEVDFIEKSFSDVVSSGHLTEMLA